MRGASRIAGRRYESKTLAAVAGVLVFLAVLGILLSLLPDRGTGEPLVEGPTEEPLEDAGEPRARRALLYDSLYREYPNEPLLDRVVGILEGAGYEVDVFLGENATLDPLYRLEEYDIVIFRAHGAFNEEEKAQYPRGAYIYTGLYLSEALRMYSGQPVRWIDEGLMAKGIIPPPGVRLSAEELSSLPRYLTLSPKFFQEVADVREGAVVLFFGCFGMDDDSLASVFLSKGARAYISWKGNVTWVYMDQVLPLVLEMVVDGNLDGIEGSVDPDPYTGSTLKVALRSGAG